MRTEVADKVAVALKADIPGLAVHVEFSAEISATVLTARYACPCGEISSLRIQFYGEEDPRSVPYRVEYLKQALRAHVRGEGNEPNF